MISHLFMTWESNVWVESEVAHLRRAEPDALSALLMRYQPFGSSKPQLDLAMDQLRHCRLCFLLSYALACESST
jgi:hypothetical protein